MVFADLHEGGEPQSHGAARVLISMYDFTPGTLLYYACLQDVSFFTEKMEGQMKEKIAQHNKIIWAGYESHLNSTL